MNKFNFLRTKGYLFALFSLVVVGACNTFSGDDETVISQSVSESSESGNYMVLPQQDPYILRTLHRANDLDLETPLRCNVNWKTQEMVQILPQAYLLYPTKGLPSFPQVP